MVVALMHMVIQFPTSPFLKVNNSNEITLNDVRMVLQWLCSYVHELCNYVHE
jgi:hypothetical protein